MWEAGTTTTTTVLRPFVWDYPGESVPEQTILDFAEADMMAWQWHQLNHMQAICTSLQKITTPAPHQVKLCNPLLSAAKPEHRSQES